MLSFGEYKFFFPKKFSTIIYPSCLLCQTPVSSITTIVLSTRNRVVSNFTAQHNWLYTLTIVHSLQMIGFGMGAFCLFVGVFLRGVWFGFFWGRGGLYAEV